MLELNIKSLLGVETLKFKSVIVLVHSPSFKETIKNVKEHLNY